MSRSLSAYLPALVWAAGLLVLGSLPRVPAPDTDLPLDKLAHFLLYGALGALAARGWLRAGRRHPAVVPLLLGLAVGAADELHQRAVPGRAPEFADWVADAAGAILAFVLVARFRRNPG